MSRILAHWSHLLYQAMRGGSIFIALLVSLNADAADNVLFQIVCPADTTVSCDAELWDLSMYGTAYIYAYGQTESAGDPISEEYNLNSCGTGTIVRTWVGYDYGNNAYYCSQTIYVSGGGAAISWPPDYVINSCNPWTDPEDLPPPYDKPIVYDGNCAQIVIGYKDTAFDINPPACKKILRKWTILDWCEYNPNDWNPKGIWEYTQVIKVAPENPPQISCPGDTVVTAGGDCSGGYVNLPPATGYSDCGANVTITNSSPYANQGGADASGNYPLGTTKIVFTARDGCGGYTTCYTYVTVQDMKAPTPICYYGISVSLMQMPDGYALDLRPEFFNKGSFDNCTPDQYLKFDIEPKTVTCENLGQTPVKVFVTDLDGNTAYCNTIVVVQDNNGICPPTNGLIQGAVYTPDGSMIEDVTVALEGSQAQDLTGVNGEYSFSTIPFGPEYTIRPTREADNTKGITTMDLVVLLKHIIGFERIEDPYLYLAADVDNSGNVSVNDLIALKDIVLRNYYALPASTQWKFVESDFAFSDPDNPMIDPIPSAYTIASFTEDMSDVNFIGVKVGDLTGDVNMPSQFAGISTRSSGMTLRAEYEAEVVHPGEKFQVTIGSELTEGAMQAIQFTLGFDTNKANFIGVSDLNMPGLTEDFFGLQDIADGKITAVWFDTEPLNVGGKFFVLTFEAIQTLDTRSFLSLDTKPTQPLAYTPQGEERNVGLIQAISQIGPISQFPETEFKVGNNYPNPFANQTIIPVWVSQDLMIEVEVYSPSGVLVYTSRVEGIKGLNEIMISSQDLQVSGLLFARIYAGQKNKTIKIYSEWGK